MSKVYRSKEKVVFCEAKLYLNLELILVWYEGLQKLSQMLFIILCVLQIIMCSLKHSCLVSQCCFS